MKTYLKISLFFFAFCLFTFAFIMPLNPPAGNWYQQFFPNLNNQQISDIVFLDSITGFAVTESLPINDSALILKTTNKGDNWVIYHRSVDDFSKVMFVNMNTGFVAGGDLLKTTNGGLNWFSINRPNQTRMEGMYVLNEDTLWVVDNDGSVGGVFRTTNGSVDWTGQQLTNGQPDKIYMFDKNLGFASSLSTVLYRTSNGGINWVRITGENGFRQISFVNNLTGWKVIGSMKKTTNGGLNWVQQTLPSGGMIIGPNASSLSVLNADTVWAAGSYVQYPNLQSRGTILRTTNGGQNWLFQIPDTTINSGTFYSFIQFTNSKTGWAHTLLTGIHTTNGGDTGWITGITQISTEVPKGYMLYQNFPNPFNPFTNIKYQISKSKYVRLIVYDVQGKEITVLVNEEQSAGTYQADWDASNHSSGVYFYKLRVTSASGGGKEVFSQTKKMILIK